MNRSIAQTSSTSPMRKKKPANKRKRKSSLQLQLLKQEFERYPDWGKDVMSEIAEKTGLSEA